MSFKKYTLAGSHSSVRCEIPYFRLFRNGNNKGKGRINCALYINRVAREKYFSENKHIELFYDSEKQLAALRPIKKPTIYSIPVVKRNGQAAIIPITGFVRAYRIDISDDGRKEILQKGELLTFKLKKENGDAS